MTVNINIDVEQTRNNTDISLELGANDTYHSSLQGRSESNQHPISAITDLTETIEGINTSIEECNSAIETKQDAIDDLAEIRAGAAKGNTAAQPNDIKNSTITFQKNQIPVGSFTLNQATNSTINFVIPTKPDDIGAMPDSIKYAANASLTINPSTFVMTLQLKDQDGHNIGNAQTIDLPLESVIVSGRYDEETKKIILTLQNGETIEFSIADLISGLQSEITIDNPLSADLVSDNNTAHKFITSTERNTWNAKQNALTEGDNIQIVNDVISMKTDGQSIVSEEGAIRTVGVYNLGGVLQTDWTGTATQYLDDVESGVITENTVCLIIDD